MKSLKPFLFTAGALIFSFSALSKPQKMFPIPEGYTTDYRKALTIELHIPPQVEKAHTVSRHNGKGRLGDFLFKEKDKNLFKEKDKNLRVCKALKVKSHTVNMGGVSYFLGTNAMDTYTYSDGVYSIRCRFHWWFKRGKHYRIYRKSPTLYIEDPANDSIL